MIPKKIILFILLSFTAATVFSQEEEKKPLSLDEALNIAKEKAYQIRAARSQAEQMKGKNLEAWSGFLPHVSISENYMNSNDPVNVFMMKLKQGVFTQQDFNLSVLNNPDDIENFTTSFQIQQPILNFDAFFGKAAASAGVKASQAGAKRTEQAIFLQVRKTYYGLILANENVKAIKEAIRSAEAHRNNARSAHEQGLINQADYLGAEVRLAELTEQGITTENQAANASDMLKLVIGLDTPEVILPTDSFSNGQPGTLAIKSGESVENRQDLIALKFQQKAASRALAMQRSSFLPRLNGFGSIEWNATEAFKKDASSWAVGLQLQWNIFQGFGNWGRSKQAAAEKRQTEIKYEEAEATAKWEIRKAQRALQSANKRIQVAQTAVTQAQESLHIVETRFEQGLEKTADLLDKEVMLTNAKLRLLKARFDLIISKSELQFALGNDPFDSAQGEESDNL